MPWKQREEDCTNIYLLIYLMWLTKKYHESNGNKSYKNVLKN